MFMLLKSNLIKYFLNPKFLIALLLGCFLFIGSCKYTNLKNDLTIEKNKVIELNQKTVELTSLITNIEAINHANQNIINDYLENEKANKKRIKELEEEIKTNNIYYDNLISDIQNNSDVTKDGEVSPILLNTIKNIQLKRNKK